MGVPPTHTITFTGGDTLKFSFQLKVKDLDFPEDPAVPRDLTGYEALAQVRQTPSSSEILATWAIIEPLDETGMIHMKLTGTQTQPLIAPKSVVSDVQLTSPDGDVETVLRIQLEVAQDVTRE